MYTTQYAYVKDWTNLTVNHEYTYPDGFQANSTNSFNNSGYTQLSRWTNDSVSFDDAHDVGNITVKVYACDEVNNCNITTYTIRTGKMTYPNKHIVPTNYTSDTDYWIAGDGSLSDMYMYRRIHTGVNGTSLYLQNRTQLNLSAVFTGNYDVQNVYDSDGNNISYTYNATTGLINFTSEYNSSESNNYYDILVNESDVLTSNYTYDSNGLPEYIITSSGVSESFWNYVRVDLPTNYSFNPNTQHIRYWICESNPQSDGSCDGWSLPVDVYSSNMGNNNASGYLVNLETYGTVDYKDKIIFNATHSTFLLKVDVTTGSESGESSGTSGGGGGGGGLVLVPSVSEIVNKTAEAVQNMGNLKITEFGKVEVAVLLMLFAVLFYGYYNRKRHPKKKKNPYGLV